MRYLSLEDRKTIEDTISPVFIFMSLNVDADELALVQAGICASHSRQFSRLLSGLLYGTLKL